MKCPPPLIHAQDVVIDTNILIYLFEDHCELGPLAEFAVAQVSAGIFSAVITPITVAEVLVKPLSENRGDIAGRYRNALRHMRNTTLSVIDAEIGHMAAALRAKYRLPLPDMLQAATCLRSRTPVLITNDALVSRVTEITVVSLAEFA